MVHAFTAMSTCAFYDSDAGFSVAYIDGKLIHFFHIKGVVTHASIALIDFTKTKLKFWLDRISIYQKALSCP